MDSQGLQTEGAVRGFKLEATRSQVDHQEAEYRRAAVAAVINRTLLRSDEPSPP